ncbi:hypothetical protein GOP47_0027250 [Adiantum capillus-veneris]|nr:hypothetical protein GOP47_0027250 [Adiantum capillus-veneris]
MIKVLSRRHTHSWLSVFAVNCARAPGSQMGGGNGQKAKMARERAQDKLKGSKGSQLESNKKAMSIQCKVCMQTFMCTTSEVKCREHAEAKHPKNDVYHRCCFTSRSVEKLTTVDGCHRVPFVKSFRFGY